MVLLLATLPLLATGAVIVVRGLQPADPPRGVPVDIALATEPARPLESAQDLWLREAKPNPVPEAHDTPAPAQLGADPRTDALTPQAQPHSGSAESGEAPPREGYFQKKNADGRVVEEGSYEHGEKEGPWTYWSDKGTKLLEGSYLHDRATGFWRGWYDDGRPSCAGSCDNGQFDGAVQFWKEDGEVDEGRSGYYRAGERIRR